MLQSNGHTKRSPSQAKKFLACAGSLAMVQTIPLELRNASGSAAQKGTCAHHIVEVSLRTKTEPEEYRGRIVVLEGDEENAKLLKANAKTPRAGVKWFEVDDDMIDGATLMTDYVRRRLDEMDLDDSALALETRTNPLPERDDCSGTADVTIDAWPDLLEVADYKNGYLTVEHQDNEQLLTYLLGKAIESGFSHSMYRVTVVQPNAEHEEGRVRSVDATAKELKAHQDRLRAGVARCEEAEEEWDGKIDKRTGVSGPPSAEWIAKWLNTGDDADHCFFCEVAPKCEARLRHAEKVACMDFDEPEGTAIPLDQSEEAVAKILRHGDSLINLVKAAKAYARRSIAAGYEVPGYKLVRGKSDRKWAEPDEKKLIAALKKSKLVDVTKLHVTKLISGPAAEKLVDRKKRKEFNDAFLVKPEGRITLAPEWDEREAVEINPGDDFETEE